MNVPPTDPMQAAFAAFTNPGSMRALLADPVRALWDDAHRIVECEVAHSRRKIYGKAASWRRSHLRVCYRLRLASSAHDEGFSAWVHGTAQIGTDRRDAPHPAAVAMGAVTLQLRRFPDDPGLPQLARLVDPEIVRTRLGDLLGIEPRGDVSIAVLCHRPAERCALRVTVGPHSAFAKTYRDGAGERVFHRWGQLIAQGSRGARQFAVAQPLAYDADTGTVWQRWLTSGTVADAVGAPEFSARLRQCVEALAGLHSVTLDDLPAKDRGVLLHETRKRAVKLAHAQPAAAASMRQVTDVLHRSMAMLPPAPHTVMHGDMHLEQFLPDGAGMAIADIDEIGLGDAEQDIAALLVDLRLRAGHDGAPVPWPEMALRVYDATAAVPVSHPLLAWHLSRHCIDKAYRLHWRNAPDLAPDITALLGWAEDASRALAGELP